MDINSIPSTYEQWRHCITVDCGLTLSAKFIDQRIEELKNESDFKTKQFLELYGPEYRDQVLSWFERARSGA